MKRRGTRHWAVWLTLTVFALGTWGLYGSEGFGSVFVPNVVRAEETEALEPDEVKAPELPSIETIQANLQSSWEAIEDLKFEWVGDYFNAESGALEDHARLNISVVMPHFVRLVVEKPDMIAGVIVIYRGDRNQVIDFNPLTEVVGCKAPEAFAADWGFELNNAAGEFSLEYFLGLVDGSLDTLTVLGSETIRNVPHVIVQVNVEGAADELATQIEELNALDEIDDIAELAETTVAWIDMERWVITKVETWDAQGRVTSRQQLNDLTLNTGLTVNQIVQLRMNNRNCN